MHMAPQEKKYLSKDNCKEVHKPHEQKQLPES